MTRLEAKSLSASGLDPFLYSGVGVEANGSELTVLSILARLGLDPWTEAGRLVTLPKAVAASWFAERITRMPLTARDIAEAPATASRLIALLPADGQMTRAKSLSESTGQLEAKMTPRWGILFMVWLALTLGAAAFTHPPATQNTPEQAGSNHPATVEPRHGSGP